MRLSRLFFLIPAVAVAGWALAPPELADAWTVLGATNLDALECERPDLTTSIPEAGFRGRLCALDGAIGLAALAERAGMDVLRSGPHQIDDDGVSFNTYSNDFAHYNPDFVEWLADNAILGEDDETIRQLTQPIYNSKARRTARVFWIVRSLLEADGYPDEMPAQVAGYADHITNDMYGPAPDTGYEWIQSTTAEMVFQGVPSAESDWAAEFEGPVAATFWVRRALDGTEDEFVDALRRLLETYDAVWLDNHPHP